MYMNSNQTIIVWQQIQTHQERVQNLVSKALAQIREKSEDNSLASIIAQIKAVLDSLVI